MKTRALSPAKEALMPHAAAKRVALYARVSTQEQTRKDYPSCESQIEELEAHCRAQGWAVREAIKDEGYSAGSLKRPGLTQVRALVTDHEVDAVLCTWYDRLTRSREFYILDAEFRTHGVDFVTIHDPADRNTASGRFLEMMLVGAKAYEREQTGEKVSTKMRQRAEKGLWNGGAVPFGFVRDGQHLLRPDESKSALLPELFRVYVENASDFAVRDWLKAHQIAAPNGRDTWPVSTIRGLLTNRRYAGEIEINKKNQGLVGLPESSAYRVVRAPHDALVPREVFELAQAVRREKAWASPNRKGRPRSYSQNQCDRVFPLQGRLYCSECRHAMTPYYVVHQPNAKEKRRSTSYVYYYICANQQMHGRRQCGHSNRVLAKRPESWIVEQLRFLAETEGLIEEAVELARAKASGDLQPQREALELNRQAVAENRTKIDRLVETITSGEVSGPLLSILNGKAAELQAEQEKLTAEQRRLNQALRPVESHYDAGLLRHTLQGYSQLLAEATPEEMQRLLRAMVQRVEWHPSGDGHAIELYCLPEARNQPSEHTEDWLERNVRNGWPQLRSFAPGLWWPRILVFTLRGAIGTGDAV